MGKKTSRKDSHKDSHGHSHRDFDSVLEALKKHKLRITEPRKAIIRILVHKHGPYTAEEIYKKISKRGCDLATVYRSITSMEKLGIVKRCEFGDGLARYELADEDDLHHHHHVICTSCKKIEPLEACELETIDRFAQKKGFSNVSHNLEFFGTCARCA